MGLTGHIRIERIIDVEKLRHRFKVRVHGIFSGPRHRVADPETAELKSSLPDQFVKHGLAERFENVQFGICLSRLSVGQAGKENQPGLRQPPAIPGKR